jgi:diguanylate cyclase (GGDEF)-like protein
MATERQLSEVLSEFARTMLTDFPIQGILEHLVRRIVEILPITAAGVTLISSSTSPRSVAASNDAALRYEELQNELGDGPGLAAYETGAAVAVPDLRRGHDFSSFGPLAIEAGLAAVFTFPLRQGDEQLGALDLYRDTPGPLSDEDMVAAQTLADVTAAYLVNAKGRADLQDSSRRAHENSLHDALTGLPNRVLLLERIEHALRRAARSGNLVAVLFVDLDRFKSVNDSYGHQVGDDLLVAVAGRISCLMRPGDTLARLSGDEFVMVCEEVLEEEQVAHIAQRVVDALALPFALAGVGVRLSVSIGTTVGGPDKRDPEDLLIEADIAMYQVKRKGGAGHQAIDLREQRPVEAWVTLQRDLGEAVQRKELRTEYQPIVRTCDGQILGVEALLRWDLPTRGSISPTILIPLAEQSGAIIEIGRWVLEKALTDRRRWGAAWEDEGFTMAVNVSAHQLMAPNFVAMVGAVIASTHTDPELLTLEITESAFVQDTERALTVLNELKGLGLMLALDDFGTGYSSLSYLKRFPVDFVKIDQSFIADLTHDRASHAIVSAIVDLAHRLDLAVVAEGVETRDQCEAVATLGGDLCQGYYFAHPMSASMLDEVMNRAMTPRLPMALPVPAVARAQALPAGGSAAARGKQEAVAQQRLA